MIYHLSHEHSLFKNEWNLFFFSKFSNNKFTLNQSFNYSNTIFILSWKSTTFESITITLVSSAKSIGKAFWINTLGKSLM